MFDPVHNFNLSKCNANSCSEWASMQNLNQNLPVDFEQDSTITFQINIQLMCTFNQNFNFTSTGNSGHTQILTATSVNSISRTTICVAFSSSSRSQMQLCSLPNNHQVLDNLAPSISHMTLGLWLANFNNLSLMHLMSYSCTFVHQ